MKKHYVKCLICGAVFEESIKECPVCGAGPENFVTYDKEAAPEQKNSPTRFVVLGGGCAAVTAADSIRQHDKTADIVLISNEPMLPYNRPMLTKKMAADLDGDRIAIHPRQYYLDSNITLMLGKLVTGIDTRKKEILILGGEKLPYDKCIYALGAECFVPPFKGNEKSGVFTIRRLADVRHLAAQLSLCKKAIVIGGGILGLEAAWEVKKSGLAVTVLETMPRLMPKQVDAGASEILQNIIKKEGIDIFTGIAVDSILGEDAVSGVRLSDGREFPADIVIISTGVKPNTDIAKNAGIEVGRSVKVNDKMETSVADIYAAGDCAEYNGANFAIWPQALAMGKVAGTNAAGGNSVYANPSPAVTLNAINIRLFAIGDNGSNPNLSYKTAEIRDPAMQIYEKCYFLDGKLCGVILINDMSKMITYSAAVNAKMPFDKLF